MAERTLTIYNGIDTADLCARSAPKPRPVALRSTLDIDEQQLVAVFVGSEWERKGLAPLIRALALAPDWALVVAGEGDEARYRELADSLGVGKTVRWLGVTDDVATCV